MKDVWDQLLISHNDEFLLLYDLNRSNNLDLPYDSYILILISRIWKMIAYPKTRFAPSRWCIGDSQNGGVLSKKHL